MTKHSDEARLTKGPIFALLMKLTMPMLLGFLGIIAFNLADTFFLGKLGTEELAAIAFTFPVVMVIGIYHHGTSV